MLPGVLDEMTRQEGREERKTAGSGGGGGEWKQGVGKKGNDEGVKGRK